MRFGFLLAALVCASPVVSQETYTASKERAETYQDNWRQNVENMGQALEMSKEEILASTAIAMTWITMTIDDEAVMYLEENGPLDSEALADIFINAYRCAQPTVFMPPFLVATRVGNEYLPEATRQVVKSLDEHCREITKE